MALTTTTDAELERRARIAFERTTALLRRTDPSLPVPGSTWTVGQVGAHLLTVIRRYTGRDFTEPAGLSDTPAGVAASNAHDVDTLDRVSHADVIDQLAAEFDSYLALDLPLEETFPFHAHQRIDGAGARSNWIGELLIHGYDIARAVGDRWPLEERDLQLVLNGVFQVAPGWLDPVRALGTNVTVVVRVAGCTPQTFRVAAGQCHIGDTRPTDRADAVIRAGSVGLALLLYKRITLATAVRRGVLVTGGRRPWVGARLPKLFLAA